ncbi:MAG: hypothetical protein O3A08_09300 [Proteobacteria bacterium]|nr:hypothetical protein [Pseudomonadota bacterium]MDA1286607.1 hypothetical protein [Pseudomonadota bacterium]
MQQNFCFAAVSNDEAKSLGCVKPLDLAPYGAVIFHPDNLPQLTLGKDRNTFCLSAPALRCGKVRQGDFFEGDEKRPCFSAV